MSLSIVFGTPTTGTPCSPSRVATPSVSSPPIAISASTPSPARLSLIRSMPLRPPPGFFSGLVRDDPRIVPPRGRMPRTAWTSRGTVSPSSGPRHPSRNPTNSRPYSCTPLRTTARITAFNPGQSPPPVRTPTRMATTIVGRRPARTAAARARDKTRARKRSGRVLVFVRGEFGLGPAGVDVDVLLTGKLRDRLHDLVGARPQQLRVRLLAVVAGEVQRLAEPHAGPDPHVRPEPARRLELEGVDHGARDYRGTGFHGQPGHPRLAAIQPAVRAPGALRVDAEHLPGGQVLQAGPACLIAGRPTGAVQGNHADPGEEAPAEQPLQAASGEVLRLAQVGHLPRHRKRPEEMVGERQVIAREDDRAPPGHVLRPPRTGPEDDLQRYPERVFRQPVAHGHIVARPGALRD